MKYLLKFGHCSFEVKEGMEYVSCNVASMILNEMAVDDLHFSDPRFDQILATYRSYWNADEPNRPVEATHFFTHHDPAVCEISINLLMEDDNYTLSKIWQRKEVHVESDEELLANGVPKAIMLYKARIVNQMISDQQQLLTNKELSDDESMLIIEKIKRLNELKSTIAQKVDRVI